MNIQAESNTFDKNIVLYAEEDADRHIVNSIENILNTSAICEPSVIPSTGFFLQIDKDGLALMDGEHVLRGDFTKSLQRLKPNNLNGELLVKAAKLKGVKTPLTAVDATAGMGEDALLLAAAGFNVQLYEQNPVIAALLYDTLRRGLKEPKLAPIVSRMTLNTGNSIEMLPELSEAPDVVVLDPMFPARQKSGLIKKKFQMLQQLEAPCSNETELLKAAISCSPKKIIIKRPLKGPYLAGVKPGYSLKGKAIRYDCIVLVGGNVIL